MRSSFRLLAVLVLLVTPQAMLTAQGMQTRVEPEIMLFRDIFFDDRNMPRANRNRMITEEMAQRMAHYRVRMEFTAERMRVAEVAYVGENREVTHLNPMGVGVIRYDYDRYGRRVTERYFLNESIKMSIAGLHQINYVFDDADREIEHRYLDEQGRPTDGIAVVRYTYLDTGELTIIRYFDARGAATVSIDSIHAYRLNWELVDTEAGPQLLMTEERREGLAGNLVNGSDGVARLVLIYNDSGRLVRRQHFDDDDELLREEDLTPREESRFP